MSDFSKNSKSIHMTENAGERSKEQAEHPRVASAEHTATPELTRAARAGHPSEQIPEHAAGEFAEQVSEQASSSAFSKPQKLGFAVMIILGALTAFDSMAIDMYLPAFSAIQVDLETSSARLQVSLSIFLIGLALGQALSGPAIDAWGRKKPLLAGVAIFGLGSALVALSGDITTFMVARFLQGLGGATGLVIPRAIVSDVCSAKESTKVFSMLMQIMSVAPIAAPPLGGLMLTHLGWQSIFWSLCIVAAVMLMATSAKITETLPAAERTPISITGVIRQYFALLCNRRYLLMTLSASFCIATLFTYISGSPTVFMEFFKLTPQQYSILFAVNATGMIIFGQLNIFLCNRMRTERLLALGYALHLSATGLLTVMQLLGQTNFYLTLVLIFFAVSSLSLLFGATTSASMFSAPRSLSGSASALLGVLQYVLGGLAGAILGALSNGTPLPFAFTLLITALLGFFCWLLGKGEKNINNQ